ncbi:MAG: prepilin-type N-terminal cleavage/methylation domain-containing protein [Candidatus Vogelbacteria bacterium]
MISQLKLKNGFGLIELLVALAIVGLLWGGVKYFKQYGNESRQALTGATEAKQQAEQVKTLIEARYK